MTLRIASNELATKVGIDPITILTFVTAILPILVQCLSTPENAEAYFRRDTPATRRQIRRACNRAWRRDHGVNAPEELVTAVQQQLATMPVGGMRALYDAS